MYIFAARFGASWYRQLIAAWLITFLGLNSGGGAGVLWANPSGGSVQSGSATINTPAPGQVTVNQTSNRAVVNWGSFSIQQGETTTFVQPSSKSAVLNRVTGGSASQINGNLNANGQVYLVNKNGVVIGKSGRVNTAGFTASTHDVSNAEFMQGGDLNFSGTSGAKVQNFGKIKATDGDVTLIAREVENHGRITARKGTVSLAGGTEVLVKPSGADGQRIYIKSKSGSGSVVNSSTGSIRATAAELRAAGGNEYALAVNNVGVIRATAVDRSGGRIVLKSERGTVQNSGKLLVSSKAPGKDGGSVIVTGENVKLTSTSRINVSSKTAKGGTVNIGGGFQGKDTAIANAKTVTMEAGAEIVSDGPVKGGTAILWSDERTDFLGSISAKGAGREVVGSGGFAEVSSKGYLNYNGTVDTAGGTLLLDPGSLTIVQYGVGLDWQGSGGNAGDPFAPNSAGADSLLNIATLRIALDNNDVWLQAGSRININTAIAPALGSYSLTLTTTDAGGSIVVNAPVTLRPDGNLTFNTTSLYLNAPLTVLGTGTISGSASLATVNVGAGGRIQNGVNAVATGGTVNVGAGTIVENISISKSVTVAGVPDTGITWSTVVDGNAAGPVFYIDAPSATVVLKNLAITNGNQPSFVVGGGGVSIANAQRVELTSVNVYGNTALSGGGIFVRNLPELLISGSVIANNTSTSALSGPSGLSSYGGGIAVNVGNSAINALVENSTISGNRSSLGAGGIHIVGGGSATLTVRNSTISSNVAAGGQGGGIRVFRFGLVVENSTIAQNTASAAGGGISNDPSGNVTIHSSIVALNTSSGGDIDGAVNSSSSYNLIGNPFGSSGFTIVTENILLNPASITWLADIGLAPLAYYGGRTQTHALLSTSLARNTGTALALTTDQRGQLRTAGLQTDIGSYEAQAAGTPSSYIVTNTRDYDATNSADAPIGGTLRLGLQGDLAEKPNLITFNIPVPGAASPDFPNYNTATGVWTIVGKTGARSFTIDRALTIDGSSQPRVTGIGNAIAVNGIGFLNNFASVFYINTPSPSAQVNLNNLLITGGKGTLDTGVLRGGGVNIFTGTATITDSTISQNSAIYGGGIDVKVTNGRLNLTRSTIERNTASSFGGGIFNQGTSTVTNSTLSGNIANQGGGINNNSGGAITIISSTISENFSSTYGGGIINFGTLTLQSTIVAGNASGFNPDVSGFVDYTSDYNLIGDSTGSSGWHPSLQNLLGTSGTPINPLLSALGDYGGITRTYALLVGSPALNAGAPTTTALDTDQRGMSRVGGARMDIGAYEAQTSYVVRNTGDYVSTGARVEHSLRAALAYYGLQPVNGAEKPASITFNISTSDPGYNPVTGVWTIRGASGATSFTINRALTIDGASQPRTIAGTTPVISIDASRFLTGFASVIRVVAGSTDDIVLNNLNLTGGKGTDIGGGTIGGGISNVNGRLSITNSTISGNEALLGGGIVNTASLSLTNTTVTGNSSTQGGGINANNGGTLTIANSTITRNSADIGGGIISLGILTIAESSLTRNWGNVGGGAYVFSGTTSLDKVTVAGNKTIAQGGGIFLNNATLNITNSTFSGNTATDGGGIHQNTGTLTVTNSTLSGNTATGIGGGLRQNAGTTTITSSTITENSAGNGGGINSSAGTLTLTSAIVARNIATTAPDVSGTVSATSDYNLIGDATGAGGSFEWSGNHNILLDPSSPTWLTDIGLAPLGNYGGPTQTHALLPGSLALNARPTLPGDLATDQRGLPRNVDGLVDIGAFESSGFTYTITSGNPSTQILSPFAPVQITVTANNPLEAVNGGAVTLIVPITPGTASATGTLTRTITGGVASFSDLIANDIFGSYAVGVRNAPGTSFTFTNTGIALIIAADGTFQIYGDADPLTYRLAGGTLLGSDILSAIFTGNLSHGNNPNAGVYDITIGTLALNAYGQSRYTFTFSDTADFTIAPRPLAVTPDSGQSKTFGETDPSPFLYTITGGSLLTGDSLTGALSRVSGEDPGFYLFLLGTLGNPNYALTLNGVPSAQFAILADNTPPAPPAPPAPPTPPKPPEPPEPPEPPTLRTISFADPNTLWFYIAPKSPIGHSGVIYYAPPPPETTGALEHGSSFKLFSGEASEVDPVR